MSELVSTLGNLIAALGTVKSAAVLEQHVAFLRTQLEFVKERVVELEEENAELIRHNAEMQEQLARQTESAQFIEHRGALFKRLAGEGNGYGETPYCPVCHRSMWSFEVMFPYECSNQSCGHKTDFTSGELKQVLSELPPV